MSVSGRAGLFTMDDGRFFGDLRGMPYTNDKRQKSGALRLEFGQLTLATAAVTSAAVTTTINTGIAVTTSPHLNPTRAVSATGVGLFVVGNTGAYTSASFGIFAESTGQFSGMNSGMNVSYMVIGY